MSIERNYYGICFMYDTRGLYIIKYYARRVRFTLK